MLFCCYKCSKSQKNATNNQTKINNCNRYKIIDNKNTNKMRKAISTDCVSFYFIFFLCKNVVSVMHVSILFYFTFKNA